MSSESEKDLKLISVLVVDDHPAVREGLGLLLEPEGITVCAEAGNHVEALARAEDCRPDLALVDLSLGEENGILLVADLHERGFPTLVYSMHEDGLHVQQAYTAGACGYVTKRELRNVLVQAIREVAAGGRFVSPRAALALADQIADPQTNANLVELSHQEREVYRLLGEGAGAKEIAAAMNISTRTVESYFARILVKFGLDGMRQLRSHAISHFRNHTS